MKSYYRTPDSEEGVHNLILQNRCGNRLTTQLFHNHTSLEVLYKPNAFRRKEYRARNFSNRDNCTALFAEFMLPEITATMVNHWGYDPFVTRLDIRTDSGASNVLTLVNLPNENCFVLSARCPLLLAIRAHEAFEVRDGLLCEHFVERGEEIVSYIAFPGMEANRYRRTDDGQYVLQIFEDDCVLIGGEENRYQVERLLHEMGGKSLTTYIADTERAIAPVMRQGALTLRDDADLQQVLDINRRMAWSGLDAGGACFGALNRIYHLIWVRDGAMAASTFARAGLPAIAEIWTPFLLANPSERRDEHGQVVREFLQIVGSRWTKTEDDGIYYAILSLFSLVQYCGDTRMLFDGMFEEILAILDHTIIARYDAQRCLFGSDTLGEDLLASNPYYGFDTVNGQMARSQHAQDGPVITRAYSLYQNMNMFNCLQMAQVLLAIIGEEHSYHRAHYAELSQTVAAMLREQFVNAAGCYRAMQVIYDDGTDAWLDFAPKSDYWEYAWAVSVGPFLPDPAVSLRSARMAIAVWPTLKSYGYCPWNFLARYLKEYGLSSPAYRALLDQQVREALQCTERYPMPGLLTEYQGAVDGWRGLPFGAGSLNLSVTSQLLQSLPLGIAVRAGNLLDRIDDFRLRNARLTVTAIGNGDVVTGVTLNGTPLIGSLQLPENRLRLGHNTVTVERGESFAGFYLYSSSAMLLDVRCAGNILTYHFDCPVAAEVIFAGLSSSQEVKYRSEAGSGELHFSEIVDTGKSVAMIPVLGQVVITVA